LNIGESGHHFIKSTLMFEMMSSDRLSMVDLPVTNNSHISTIRVTQSTDEVLSPGKPVDKDERCQLVDRLIESFNRDLNTGWAEIVESKVIDCKQDSEIANFFYNSYGVDPDNLGDFLGKEARSCILDHFVKLNDFSGLSVADAVRHMLRKFKPRGENAIIDRMITAFSFAYSRDNPATFRNPDTPYQLAFALLMVNTSAHNSSAVGRAPEFVRNCKSFKKVILKELCRDEGNLDEPMLKDMYDSIVQRPIELVPDRYMNIFRDSVRSGWVIKKSSNISNSEERRLLVLSGHESIGFALYYFSGGKDRAWRVMIPLADCVICELHKKRPESFVLRSSSEVIVTAAKRHSDGFIEKSKKRQFEFICTDERQAMHWLSEINLCIRMDV